MAGGGDIRRGWKVAGCVSERLSQQQQQQQQQ